MYVTSRIVCVCVCVLSVHCLHVFVSRCYWEPLPFGLYVLKSFFVSGWGCSPSTPHNPWCYVFSLATLGLCSPFGDLDLGTDYIPADNGQHLITWGKFFPTGSFTGPGRVCELRGTAFPST